MGISGFLAALGLICLAFVVVGKPEKFIMPIQPPTSIITVGEGIYFIPPSPKVQK